MRRLLFLLALLYLLWQVLRLKAHTLSRRVGASGTDRRARPVTPDLARPLVRCAGCGIFVPAETLRRDRAGLEFCSDECRQRLAAAGERAAS